MRQALLGLLRRHGRDGQEDIRIGLLELRRPVLEIGDAALASGFKGDDVPELQRPGIFAGQLLGPEGIDVFMDAAGDKSRGQKQKRDGK